MIHTNRWRPDTCSCILQYQFDDNGQNNPQLSNHQVLPCQAHRGLGDAKAIFDEIVSENETKNVILGKIQEYHPELFDELNQPIPGKLQWGFTANRDLKFDMPDLRTDQKAALDGQIKQMKPAKRNIIIG